MLELPVMEEFHHVGPVVTVTVTTPAVVAAIVPEKSPMPTAEVVGVYVVVAGVVSKFLA